MQIHGVNPAISLEGEQSLRIQSRNHVEIVCLSGRLWVTQPGDARDLFVAPGAPLRLAPSGLTLVTALVPSVLRAREVAAEGGPRPWPGWPSPSVARSVRAVVLRLGAPGDRIAGL